MYARTSLLRDDQLLPDANDVGIRQIVGLDDGGDGRAVGLGDLRQGVACLDDIDLTRRRVASRWLPDQWRRGCVTVGRP